MKRSDNKKGKKVPKSAAKAAESGESSKTSTPAQQSDVEKATSKDAGSKTEPVASSSTTGTTTGTQNPGESSKKSSSSNVKGKNVAAESTPSAISRGNLYDPFTPTPARSQGEGAPGQELSITAPTSDPSGARITLPTAGRSLSVGGGTKESPGPQGRQLTKPTPLNLVGRGRPTVHGIGTAPPANTPTTATPTKLATPKPGTPISAKEALSAAGTPEHGVGSGPSSAPEAGRAAQKRPWNSNFQASETPSRIPRKSGSQQGSAETKKTTTSSGTPPSSGVQPRTPSRKLFSGSARGSIAGPSAQQGEVSSPPTVVAPLAPSDTEGTLQEQEAGEERKRWTLHDVYSPPTVVAPPAPSGTQGTVQVQDAGEERVGWTLRTPGGRFPGDDDGYGGRDALFEVLPDSHENAPRTRGKIPPTFKSGHEMPPSPPNRRSVDEGYRRQLEKFLGENPTRPGPPLDDAAEALFAKLSEPEDVNPAKREFQEYSKRHFEEEAVNLGQAALNEVETQSTEYMAQKFILEGEKSRLEKGLAKTQEHIKELREMHDRNDPKADYKRNEIRRLEEEVLELQKQCKKEQKELRSLRRSEQYLQTQLVESEERNEGLLEEIKDLEANLKNQDAAKEKTAAEERSEREKEELKAKIGKLQVDIQKLAKERGGKGPGSGGSRGEPVRQVDAAAINSKMLRIDFSHARCELALRRMANDRAIIGFMDRDTNEAIEAVSKALELAEKYEGDDRLHVLARAQFWAGVTYYYADNEQKATAYFKTAKKGLAGSDGYEAGWVDKWAGIGTLRDVPKDAESYRPNAMEARRTSRSTDSSNLTTPSPTFMKGMLGRIGIASGKKKKKKSSGPEAGSSKSPEEKQKSEKKSEKPKKSEKTKQSHPPVIKDEKEKGKGKEKETTADDTTLETEKTTPTGTSGQPAEGPRVTFADDPPPPPIEEENLYDA